MVRSVDGRTFIQMLLERAASLKPGDGQFDIPCPTGRGITDRIRRSGLAPGFTFPHVSYKARSRSRRSSEGGRKIHENARLRKEGKLAPEKIPDTLKAEQGWSDGGKASQDAAKRAGEAQGHSHAYMTLNRMAGGTDDNVKTQEQVDSTLTKSRSDGGTQTRENLRQLKQGTLETAKVPVAEWTLKGRRDGAHIMHNGGAAYKDYQDAIDAGADSATIAGKKRKAEESADEIKQSGAHRTLANTASLAAVVSLCPRRAARSNCV